MMGMFDAAPQEQPAAQPQQGMMSGQPDAPTPEQKEQDPNVSHGGFNGQVTVEGKPVMVRKGVAQVEGQPYFVSDSGAMVVDNQGRLIGHVTNGEFQVVTPEYTQQMRQAGYVQ